jgi:dGTPase
MVPLQVLKKRPHKLASIREDMEAWEKEYLSPCASLSSESRGRATQETPCPIRTIFQRDRDRIVYSNAFRRLKHKTQVFLSPLGDHYRTRLTHTLEVSEIARTIARALRLNEDLAEAIALGHDLGHTPFGHGGEVVLKEIYSEEFSHGEQSVRVIDVLENHGQGLNLTYEVRDGILQHSKGYGAVVPDEINEMPVTVEGRVVRFADIMAYLNHDLDDAIRSGVIHRNQVPKDCRATLGRSHSERVRTMINDLVISTRIEDGEMHLTMSQSVSEGMAALRQFLYDNV